MTCGTLACSRHQKEFEIAGTWDFKWPIGSTIRFAFQLAPKPNEGERRIDDADYATAIDIVIGCIELWQRALKANNIPLILQATRGFLLDPPLGVNNSGTDQYRSPFLLQDTRSRPYDVLISLRDLPIPVVDPLASFGSMTEQIIFPAAELGVYNRRADYGSPSVYLGRFGKFVEQYPALSDYLRTPLATHIVMHELGHVLGLPHLDQSPLLPLRNAAEGDAKEVWIQRNRRAHYKPARDIRQVIDQELGVEVSLGLVDAHLIGRWPGSLDYSDWLLFDREEADAYLKTSFLPSIMAFPFHSEIVRGSPAARAEPLAAPQPVDIRHLQYMYDPSFKDDLRIMSPEIRNQVAALFQKDIVPPKSLAAEDLRAKG